MTTRIINIDLLQKVSIEAQQSERKRTNYNFHELSDPVNRFLNAIEPDSYIQPHRHIDPIKDEAFILLKGKGAAFIFDDNGNIIKSSILSHESGNLGIDIPGGVFHTVISLASGTVFYELKSGPYQPLNAKNFANWAPKEGDSEVPFYLNQLRQHIQKNHSDT